MAAAEGGGGAGAAVAETVTAAGAGALPASSIGGGWRLRRPSRDRGGGRSCCCRHPGLGSAVAAAAPSSRASAAVACRGRRRVAPGALSIRCEQSAKQGGGGGSVWLGRAAMVGFASAIAVEVSTGKGVLQNLGVAAPAPTLALVVSALVVGLAVFFLLQSGSRD